MINADRIEDILHVLQQDGVMLYPTDTIWGLGCHYASTKGLEKIFEIKQRPKDKPLIALADSIGMIKDVVNDIHPRIETLLQYHRKPLTIIYPEPREFIPLLCHPSGSIAIRLTHDPYCKFLIRTLGAPIVATSANKSGEPFPNSFDEVDQSIINAVDYVAKAGSEIKKSDPSVIVSYDKNGELTFLRE